MSVFECNILKETSNAKSELVILEWTTSLCICLVLYDMRLANTFVIAMCGDMRLVNTFVIAMCGVMSYSLLCIFMIYKEINFTLRWKFLSVYKETSIVR